MPVHQLLHLTRTICITPLVEIHHPTFQKWYCSGIRWCHNGRKDERRKRKRKKYGKGYEKISPKARKANRMYSQWSFAELHALNRYKAALSGSLAIKVDADYTSKACPICGHTADENALASTRLEQDGALVNRP